MPESVNLPLETHDGFSMRFSGNNSPWEILKGLPGDENFFSRRKTISRTSMDSASRSPVRVASGLISSGSAPKASSSTSCTLSKMASRVKVAVSGIERLQSALLSTFYSRFEANSPRGRLEHQTRAYRRTGRIVNLPLTAVSPRSLAPPPRRLPTSPRRSPRSA